MRERGERGGGEKGERKGEKGDCGVGRKNLFIDLLILLIAW